MVFAVLENVAIIYKCSCLDLTTHRFQHTNIESIIAVELWLDILRDKMVLSLLLFVIFVAVVYHRIEEWKSSPTLIAFGDFVSFRLCVEMWKVLPVYNDRPPVDSIEFQFVWQNETKHGKHAHSLELHLSWTFVRTCASFLIMLLLCVMNSVMS